jgi:threonine/homoserine/homoserine lactone efflux protein
MAYVHLFILGFIVGLSGALIPGPLLVFTVSRTLRGNVRTALKIITGHVIVELALVTVILIWLEQIRHLEVIGTVISLVGGSAILLFGVLMVLGASKYSLPEAEADPDYSTSARGDITGGAFFSAFNASFPLWWLTIGAFMVMSARELGVIGVVVFMMGHWLSDVGWYGLVGIGVVKGRKLLSDKLFHVVLRALGVGLAGFGAYLLFSQFEGLLF